MLNITARGFKLRDEIKEKVSEELKRVEKMLPESAEFDVTFTLKHEEFKCDITVKHIGAFIRGEAVADDVMPVVDFAVDDLKRKLRKLKTKLRDKHNYFEGYSAFVENFDEGEEDDKENFDLARVKELELRSMSDEEAGLQMEMLGHSFFAYVDENGFVAIIYKRNENDTSYGKLILHR